MSKLQKRAWFELAGILVAVAVAAIGLAVLVRFNANGIFDLVIFSTAFLVAGLVATVRSIRDFSGFDEREKKIYIRAFVIACGAFASCNCFISFCVFFIAGAKSLVPVYILPAMFLLGLFIAQFVQSTAILIQFALEQADEQ
jgi:hypothetical protein